jgi:dolichol-phosphate mannosyltransferase
MNEKNTFLQGQILWTGFPPKVIPYTRAKREIGSSKWTLGKKIKYFIDGFMTYTYFPLRFISISGMLIALLGFAYALLIFFMKLTANIPIEGWAPLMIIVLVLSGVQMIMLGIIGEYLWRNYDETRKRPLYVVEKVMSKEEQEPS